MDERMLPRTDPSVVPRAQQGPKRELWEATEGAEGGQSLHSSDPFPPWGVGLVGSWGLRAVDDTVLPEVAVGRNCSPWLDLTSPAPTDYPV